MKEISVPLFSPQRLLARLALGFALAASLTPALVRAQAAPPPTIVSGSKFVTTSTMTGIVAKGLSGSQMTGNVSLGISPFSLSGSMTTLVNALTTTIEGGLIDVQAGSTVTGTQISTNSVMAQLDVSGARVSSGVVRIGGTPK